MRTVGVLKLVVLGLLLQSFSWFWWQKEEPPKNELEEIVVSPPKKKKKKKKGKYKAFKKIIPQGAASMLDSSSLCSVYRYKGQYYLSMPYWALKREFLVVNSLSKVSTELNLDGVNRAQNYANKLIGFALNQDSTKLLLQQHNGMASVESNSRVSASVKQNFTPATLYSLPILSLSPDSAGVVVKITQLIDGSNTVLNRAFQLYDASQNTPKKGLSEVLSVRSYARNLVVKAAHTLQQKKKYLSVETTTNIVLLSEVPMPMRLHNAKIGYFTTPKLLFSDLQYGIEETQVINRWRLVPRNKGAYLMGELSEPERPIVFYLDASTPKQWQQPILKGVRAWNKAFEAAGFKNAIQAKLIADSMGIDPSDARYSSINYVASSIPNAMGPTVVDPRSGEIIESDVIWWHNVLSVAERWARLYLAHSHPGARQARISENLMGRIVQYIATHEIGHSLGLKHNMKASSQYPTDSLLSPKFLAQQGSISASVMDYARLNFLQNDTSLQQWVYSDIGPYDKYAIDWGYRWFPDEVNPQPHLRNLLARYKGKPYLAYGEQQNLKTASDPSALTEDLGDDPVKTGRIAVQRFENLINQLDQWFVSRYGDYKDLGLLYSRVIKQWSMHLYHVMAQIGGIYKNHVLPGDTLSHRQHVPSFKQQESLDFIKEHLLHFPAYLYTNERLNKKVYPLRVQGRSLVSENIITHFTNTQAHLMWDLLNSKRISRMLEHQSLYGDEVLGPIDFFEQLHNEVFKSTKLYRPLSLYERITQKNYVDALIVSASRSYPATKYQGVTEQDNIASHSCSIGTQVVPKTAVIDQNKRLKSIDKHQGLSRLSEDVSIKKGELSKVLKLLKRRVRTAHLPTRYHYLDLIRRVEHIIGEESQ